MVRALAVEIYAELLTPVSGFLLQHEACWGVELEKEQCKVIWLSNVCISPTR